MKERRKRIRRTADRDVRPERRGMSPASNESQRRRRRAIRHDCTASFVIEIARAAGGTDDYSVFQEPVEARVLDLSAEGAFLFSPHSLAMGHRFSLEIRVGTRGRISVEAEVRWCEFRERKGGYAIGVKFTHLASSDAEQIRVYLEELDATMGM